MAGTTAGSLGDPAVADIVVTDRPDTTRQYVAAAVLTLAVLSLPLLAGRLRRGRALVVALMVLLAGVALVRADIAAPSGGPQTVEVVIVPGNGPVQVQLSYPQAR